MSEPIKVTVSDPEPAPPPAEDDREAIAPGDEHYYRPPSIADGTVDPGLVASLHRMGANYGPRGVAKVAAELAGGLPPSPEVQAVLDAAEAWEEAIRQNRSHGWTKKVEALTAAVRAYQATLGGSDGKG